MLKEYMPCAVDTLLAVIVLIALFEGRRRGFVKMLLSAVSVVASAIAARVAAQPAAGRLYDTIVERRLITAITEKLEATSKAGAEALAAAVPDSVTAVADNAGVNLINLISDIGLQGLNSEEIAVKITESVLEPIMLPVLSLFSFAVITVILSGVLAILIGSLKPFRDKKSVLGAADRVMGMAFGLVKGAVISVAVALLLYVAAELFTGSAVSQAVAESKLIPVIASFII